MPMRLALPLLLLAMLLAACGPGSDMGSAQPLVDATPEELVAHGMLVQASVAHTGALPEAIAARYGVQRERHGFMLVVRVASPDPGAQAPTAAKVTASMRDLRGVQQTIALANVDAGTAMEYVGTFQIQPPDTLTLEVEVTTAEGLVAPLRFSREVMPAQP